MEVLRTLNRMFSLPLLLFLWTYQNTLSPDHGPFKFLYPYGFCKYHPSCSMYAKEVLRRDGVLGLPKIVKRLISCNPYRLGGIDLPPHQK